MRLPAILSDHMVLQAGKPAQLWGWATPGASISAEFRGASARTVTPDSGRWQLSLPTGRPGGPFTLNLSGDGDTIVLQDVLVGEVWLASGQSNMQWRLDQSHDPQPTIAASTDPQLRLFTVPRRALPEPQHDVQAEWVLASPETTPEFSAVAYYFGADLRQATGHPVGLIHSSWGGTPAEAWTPMTALKSEPLFADMVKTYEAASQTDTLDLEALKRRAYQNTWKAVETYQDPGNRAYLQGWAEPDFNDSTWETMEIPALWQNHGINKNGAFWFRTVVDIPASMAGTRLRLSLGAIDDFDVTYWNGLEVGRTGEETPSFWQHPRVYEVPAMLVQPGKNVIAIRVFDRTGQGGFTGPAAALTIEPAGPEAHYHRINLAGTWKFHPEYGFPAGTPALVRQMGGLYSPGHHHALSNLYNAMIHPLVPYSLRGFIWYQGESNADRADAYRTLFPLMIQSWRNAWEDPSLAFYPVLLAGFRTVQSSPSEEGWGPIRDAQLQALKLPHTGIASAMDVGDAQDIHPRDKRTVGERLARLARAHIYGEDIEASGPVLARAQRQGSEVRLEFDHAEGGLRSAHGSSPSGDLEGFALRAAGSEATWEWARARIHQGSGNVVVLSHPEIDQPAAVRYLWGSNPTADSYLYNSAGLPALPFEQQLD